MSTWNIFDADKPDEVLAVVSFGNGVPEDQTGQVRIETDSDEIRNFVIYYLADPLNTGHVYIEGLGARRGPHWDDLEQFEQGMSVLGGFYPGFGTERIS